MLQDIYTREVRAKPLLNKKPETGNAAVRSLMPTLVEEKTDYSITTDNGNDFSKLDEGGIPADAVHREKKATNDIAVIDRAMQGVKQDSAVVAADGDAKNWVEGLSVSVSAHNRRPHSAVHGPPETVESRSEQGFRVLQDNARNGVIEPKRSTQQEQGVARGRRVQSSATIEEVV